MKRLTLLLAMMALNLATSALSQNANSVDDLNKDVKLAIGCSNAVLRPEAEVFISLSITNSSTNVVGLSAPLCEPEAYEIWVTDASGHTEDIGVKRAKPNGPGASASGMNLIHQIHPAQADDCVLKVSLGKKLRPGKYALRVKRWCVTFTSGADAKATASSNHQLVSNSIALEIRRP